MRKARKFFRGLWFDYRYRKHKDQEGCCMCGTPESQHNDWNEGHSYVDSWHYYRDSYVNAP